MKLSQTVRSGPDHYICQANALSLLDEKIQDFNHPVIITGDKSYQAFKKHYSGTRNFPIFRYDRTASNEDMARLAELTFGTDCIIGVGGGRVLDTAKGTAALLGIDCVTVPTVLGTCAAYTPVSAVYHPDRTFKAVDYYKRAPYLCLMDLTLLMESPLEYFMGGIGDTLAKWYEAEGITSHLQGPLPAMVTVGLQTAKVTQELLLEESQEAIMSLKRKELTPAFQKVAEAVVAIAGTVGGFAGESGRMAGAHAVHNGMSLVKETHAYEHGVKVAYGILVQLTAAGKLKEAQNLQNFYEINGFYQTLSDFGVHKDLEDKMWQIASFASSPNETFTLAVPDATTQSIFNAMKALESLSSVPVEVN
ncbi:MAG: iron-containing alcohol dehydrogenase family protein [Alkalibacterium sp.]|nr:iron-containing alcohol dehydrogenase family protein [Alkalibacterium sp.]